MDDLSFAIFLAHLNHLVSKHIIEEYIQVSINPGFYLGRDSNSPSTAIDKGVIRKDLGSGYIT